MGGLRLNFPPRDIWRSTVPATFKEPLSKITEEKAPFIFPTNSRARHSKLVSYPVGAEILSRALDGVPQDLALTCTFSAGNPHRGARSEHFRVMHVSYRKGAKSHFDGADALSCGVYDPFWEIWIFDVQVSLRAKVKQVLTEIGLPLMTRPWLKENAAIEGRTGEAVITLEYDMAKDGIVPISRTNILPEKNH